MYHRLFSYRVFQESVPEPSSSDAEYFEVSIYPKVTAKNLSIEFTGKIKIILSFNL